MYVSLMEYIIFYLLAYEVRVTLGDCSRFCCVYVTSFAGTLISSLLLVLICLDLDLDHDLDGYVDLGHVLA